MILTEHNLLQLGAAWHLSCRCTTLRCCRSAIELIFLDVIYNAVWNKIADGAILQMSRILSIWHSVTSKQHAKLTVALYGIRRSAQRYHRFSLLSAEEYICYLCQLLPKNC